MLKIRLTSYTSAIVDNLKNRIILLSHGNSKTIYSKYRSIYTQNKTFVSAAEAIIDSSIEEVLDVLDPLLLTNDISIGSGEFDYVQITIYDESLKDETEYSINAKNFYSFSTFDEIKSMLLKLLGDKPTKN